MTDQLKVELRESRGKHRTRRLRKSGSIPAVLYGHKEETVSLAVPTAAFEAAIRHGSRMVDLTGAVNESALISEVQWDTFGTEVLHVDFTRVRKDERVEAELPVELRGEAPGSREGGRVEQVVYEVLIECPAVDLPENLPLSINSLKLGESLTAAQIKLPASAKLLTPADTVVVHCTHAVVEEEEEIAAPGEGAEPEVIGRKEEEGEEESSD